MSPHKKAVTLTEIYDRALQYARDQQLPPGCPRPLPTRDWPEENVRLLERYRDWLESGGASQHTIRLIYLTMAGHVLGLNRKPSALLDLDADLQKAMEYVRAKQLSAEWTDINLVALEKFRRFLRNERGLVESKIASYDISVHTEGLPDWLVEQLTRYQHVQQRNWRDARVEQNIRRFWNIHLRAWRFLVEQRGVRELAHLKRSMLHDFTDQRLQEGRAATTINTDLRCLHAFLLFLQDQGCAVPHALLRLPTLKEPDSLPRFLTDEQVRLLRDDFEARVGQATRAAERRDALLDRACFYLLWQSALRIGELEELRLEDLDLEGKRLMVRRGKGKSDRAVFLTQTSVQAVRAYLAVRGMGPTDHLFLYRNQPVCKDLVRDRIQAAGRRVGVHVYPHRLRHTAATQLLNAGCRITSIQKFLGHKCISTTLGYARVHDQTVADDYYMAMGSVEKRLELMGQPEEKEETVTEDERERLLALTAQLAAPELTVEARLVITAQIRLVLLGETEAFASEMTAVDTIGDVLLEHPPPDLVLYAAS